MRVKELTPGMLLIPTEGYSWFEIPWRGTEGVIVGYYLHVASSDSPPVGAKPARNEPVLYLGTADDSTPKVTPGRQVALAWGAELTIEPMSWKYIRPHE